MNSKPFLFKSLFVLKVLVTQHAAAHEPSPLANVIGCAGHDCAWASEVGDIDLLRGLRD